MESGTKIAYLDHWQWRILLTQPKRSTSDVVWAHRWLVAKATSNQLPIKITGIDMSAAFDTINRQKLLNILEDILGDDELRMVRFLLSNTNLTIKMRGASADKPFPSNIGTPQGDGLSPILFVVYLENALREVRTTITNVAPAQHLPQEIAYADDVDFISISEFRDDVAISKALEPFNLKVNTEKTEKIEIKRKDEKVNEEWRCSKKLGSLLGDEQDIQRRKCLSTIAMNKLTKIWIRKDKLKLGTRLRLYKSLVKPILLYNSGTWGITGAEEDKLNKFHRKQLRRVMGIRYPHV